MNFFKRKVGDIFGFTKRIDGLIASAKHQAKMFEESDTKRNDAETSLRQRLSYQQSRNDSLRDALARKTADFDALKAEFDKVGESFTVGSDLLMSTELDFQQALDHLTNVMNNQTPEEAFKEAEKFYNRFRSTKTCIKCNSEMIPLRSEDKKLCSNGACGHEVEWPLEEGQDYMHKRNVEPFIEDRSNVQAAIEE